MALKGVVVYDRRLFCGYMYDLRFLWMKRHLPRLLRSS